MCAIDFEPCEVWRETTRTARKQHRCSCCGGPIRAGEQYVDHFSVYEGDPSREKCCVACEADRKAFASAHDNMRPAPSSLVAYVRECIGDDEEMDAKWRAMLDGIKARGSAPATTGGSDK